LLHNLTGACRLGGGHRGLAFSAYPECQCPNIGYNSKGSIRNKFVVAALTVLPAKAGTTNLTWINQKSFCSELTQINAKKKFVKIRVNLLPKSCSLYKHFIWKVLTLGNAPLN
jgi:hypothetical protein